MNASGLVIFAVLVSAGASVGQGISLTLHHDQVRQLDHETKTKIQTLALRFLESSNFNSIQHRDILKVTTQQVHAAYRTTVAGHYLLLVFEKPHHVKTVGGDINVLEAVIGLNGPDYANSLFTIDEQGRVISHEKYSGQLGIELLQAVKQSSLAL
jgi:hypothetical protein